MCFSDLFRFGSGLANGNVQMATLFSTGHWPQLLFRPKRVAVDAPAKPKDRAIHVMADSAPGYRRAACVFVQNYQERQLIQLAGAARTLTQATETGGRKAFDYRELWTWALGS